jgi:hypothetical protein
VSATRSFRALCVVSALSAVFGAWVAAGLGGETTTRAFDDLATIAAVVVAAALCARAARRHVGRLRLHWWLLTAGCGAWALGEVLWACYDLVSGTVPETSWADVAYLAALPPVAAALLVHPALRRRAIGTTRALVDGLVLAASLLFAAWSLVLEPLQRSADLTNLAGLVTAAYPVGDVVIIFLVVVVIRGTTSSARFDLWWLLVGLLMIAFSDAVYSYLTQVRSFSTGGIVDTGWFAGYLAIAVGAWCARSPAVVQSRQRPSRALTPAAIVVPFLPMLAALLLVAARLESGQRLDHLSLTLAFVLVGLVLLRQILLLVDLLVPAGEPRDGVANRLVAAVGEVVADEPPRRDLALGAPR